MASRKEYREKQNAAYKLYEQGMSASEIADAIGTTRQAVTKWRKLWGAPRPSQLQPLDPSAQHPVVDDAIKGLSWEAFERLRGFVHHEDPRIALSASLQALALAGHVPPARKPSVQPSDGASRRGSAIARLSAGVTPDEGRAADGQSANATGAPDTDCASGDTMTHLF